MALLKGLLNQITIPTIAEIDQSHGKILSVRFDVTFKTLSVSQKREVLAEIKSAEGDDADPWDSIIPRYLVGWNLTNDDGDVPFTEDTLAAVLDAQPYRVALVDAFLGLIGGNRWLESHRRKN
jgi:hypothetical protein